VRLANIVVVLDLKRYTPAGFSNFPFMLLLPARQRRRVEVALSQQNKAMEGYVPDRSTEQCTRSTRTAF